MIETAIEYDENDVPPEHIPPKRTEYDALADRVEELHDKVDGILNIMANLQNALGQASKHPMLGAFFGGIGG